MTKQSGLARKQISPSRPQFLIIGAAKAGTTTLYDDLATHPDASLPSNKEPAILHHAQDVSDALRLWERHFAQTRSDAIRGEASTMYTMVPEFPEVASFAREALGPDLRIVYLMREPISRIESHLAHDHAAGRLDGMSFDRAALEFSRYVSWSDYPRQIAPWIDAFGADNVKLVIFEEMVARRAEVVRDVAAFVGLDPLRQPSRSTISNNRGSQRIARTEWLGKIAYSKTYRLYLRALIPTAFQDMARKRLTKATDVVDVRLSDKTREELASRLRHVAPGIRALGVDTSNWW